MNTLAATIDDCRAALAEQLRAGGMPLACSVDLNTVRAALFFYRQQRCPGVDAIEAQSSPRADRLGHAARCLEALLYDAGNSELQLRMLRGCLSMVCRVIGRNERPAAPAAFAHDWRAAQLPTGDQL